MGSTKYTRNPKNGRQLMRDGVVAATFAAVPGHPTCAFARATTAVLALNAYDELIEACRYAMQHTVEVTNSDAHEMLRAAIAKAEGTVQP